MAASDSNRSTRTPGNAAPPHAGVHVPPPFIYAAFLLTGYLLERFRPLPVATSDETMIAVEGAAFVWLALWGALFAAAFVQFARKKTTLIPNRPATALATGGIYRVSRNPMYVSLVCLYLGLTLLLNSWWPIVLLPVLVIVMNRLVIAREERYLGAAFPQEYAAYRVRVRRWL